MLNRLWRGDTTAGFFPRSSRNPLFPHAISSHGGGPDHGRNHLGAGSVRLMSVLVPFATRRFDLFNKLGIVLLVSQSRSRSVDAFCGKADGALGLLGVREISRHAWNRRPAVFASGNPPRQTTGRRGHMPEGGHANTQ
jgi:hypothetical protein